VKRLVVLGATGSIGRRTLELVERFPDEFGVEALAARGSDPALLVELCRRHRPRLLALTDRAAVDAVARALGRPGPEIVAGADGLVTAASLPDADTVLSAIVGGAGLLPTMAAIRSGKTVALANKETLVMAGSLMTAAARQRGVSLLPVDSEHSAIFQCLVGHNASEVARILLTASGGPFREWPGEAIDAATVADALRHPTWKMGAKITVDSATLMNKGLEVIEARWLFDLAPEQVQVVVHPQSVVHSMVEYVDGSVIAQLGVADMGIPILYALTYPRRLPCPADRLDLTRVGPLTFEPPDVGRFPCLGLARQALVAGGTAPVVLNAANEVAVAAFLDGRIGFGRIAALIGEALARIPGRALDHIEGCIEVDGETRRCVETLIAARREAGAAVWVAGGGRV
jgi:1-deoxy-D-xylulose-5-phosphate reductoisomerase